MERVGVRQLQQNAAKIIRRVRNGERIEVTDRGRPVAAVIPLTHGDVLEALEAAGRLVRGEGNLLDVPPLRVPRGKGTASRHLARLREFER